MSRMQLCRLLSADVKSAKSRLYAVMLCCCFGVLAPAVSISAASTTDSLVSWKLLKQSYLAPDCFYSSSTASMFFLPKSKLQPASGIWAWIYPKVVSLWKTHKSLKGSIGLPLVCKAPDKPTFEILNVWQNSGILNSLMMMRFHQVFQLEVTSTLTNPNVREVLFQLSWILIHFQIYPFLTLNPKTLSSNSCFIN